MIRAAFFDIDGTLVSLRTHDIPTSAVRALEEMHEAGTLLFLATGRSTADLPRPIRELDARVPFDGFLTFNGQYCYDAAGEVFRDAPIDARDTARITALAADGTMDIAVMQLSRMFVSRHTPRVVAAEAAVDNVTPVGDLALALEECTAFGDGGNDVPMFGCVGVSVAMGNAADDVKAAATMVAPDVDDDGLLVACCELGLVD